MLHQIMLNQFSKFIRKLYIFYRTRTMASELYIIDRLYFEELGMYDEGIKIRGEKICKYF